MTDSTEARLEIDDNVARLALILLAEMDRMPVREIQRLEGLLGNFKLNKQPTATQIHKAFAHIGCLYVDAVKKARDAQLAKT